MIVQNGQIVTLEQALSGTLQDAKGNKLNFEQVKDTVPPVYEARPKERTVKEPSIYRFQVGDAVVSIQAVTELSLKEQRKLGYPVPKDKAKSLDEEIAKDKEKTVAKTEQTEEAKTSTNESIPQQQTLRGRPKS